MAVAGAVALAAPCAGQSAASAPPPAPEAEWRAWLAWLAGPRVKSVRATPFDDLYFQRGHAESIRFHERSTGRNVEAEIRRAYETALGDSARFVYGVVLTGLDPDVFPTEQILEMLQAEGEPIRELARRPLGTLFRRDRSRDEAVGPAEWALADSVVAQIVDDAPNWPFLVPSDSADAMKRPPLTVRDSVPIFVADTGMSDEALSRWQERGVLLSTEAWMARVPREPAAFVRVSGVRRRGPFVMVPVRVTVHYRAEGEVVLRDYAYGTNLVLAWKDGRWWVVTSAQWIS